MTWVSSASWWKGWCWNKGLSRITVPHGEGDWLGNRSDTGKQCDMKIRTIKTLYHGETIWHGLHFEMGNRMSLGGGVGVGYMGVGTLVGQRWHIRL